MAEITSNALGQSKPHAHSVEKEVTLTWSIWWRWREVTVWCATLMVFRFCWLNRRTNPVEKYVQIGSSHQGSGWWFLKYLKPPASYTILRLAWILFVKKNMRCFYVLRCDNVEVLDASSFVNVKVPYPKVSRFLVRKGPLPVLTWDGGKILGEVQLFQRKNNKQQKETINSDQDLQDYQPVGIQSPFERMKGCPITSSTNSI